jgi:uncharacterized SAM-binding protein YcdF (DUF218 family)
VWTDAEVRTALEVAWDYMRFTHPPVEADAILALGSFDPEVATHAAGLWKAGFAPVLIVSGGVPYRAGFNDFDPERVEAEVFAGIAGSLGVPREAIVIEDRAQNTGENFRFSRAMAECIGLKPSRLLVVAKPYMTRRGYATGHVAWPSVELLMQCEVVDCAAYFSRHPEPELVLHSLVGDLHRLAVYPGLGFHIEQEFPRAVIEALGSLVRQGYDGKLVPGYALPVWGERRRDGDLVI